MSTTPPTAAYAGEEPRPQSTPFRDILAYSIGDGANSLIMNTFFGFAMLYYTKALGLSGTLAGIIMLIITLWDAFTDPLMGHITDNTRSVFGRRHPWMLLGGFVAMIGFFAVWTVPAWFTQSEIHIFWYLVAMNILMRTGGTIFAVPYIALGFEICTHYTQRTTLQGVRTAVNMAVNLGSTVLIWLVILRDEVGLAGSGVAKAENYQLLGLVFSIAALCFIIFVVFATRKYANDSRANHEIGDISLKEILANLKDVLFDPHPRTVFCFIAVLFVGVVFVTSLQMFVYVDFMLFAPLEKALVHGSTMVAAGIGGLLAGSIVNRLDKKPAIYMLLGIACFGNIMLVVLFATGLVPKDYALSSLPVATLIFLIFHDLYHVGSTAATTIANSMMADISEIARFRTGRLRDGSYSAMLSFVLKLAISVGMLLCGVYLDLIGHEEGNVTPQVATYMMYGAFLGGTLLTFLACLVIVRYPIDRDYLAKLRDVKPSPMVPVCGFCQFDLSGNTTGTCPKCGGLIPEGVFAKLSDPDSPE